MTGRVHSDGVKNRFSKDWRGVFWFVLKLGISLGIILWITIKWHDKVLAGFRDFRLVWLVPAAILYGLHIPAFSWRWLRLARMLGIRLSATEALSLSAQGLFFSLVIPGGAFGGDIVKAGVLSKRTLAGAKVEGAFTVLMDRIVGMISLFLLALCLIPFAWPLFRSLPLPGWLAEISPHWILWGCVSLSLAGLAASCAVFFHKFFQKFRFFDVLIGFGDRLSHGLVSRLTSAVDIYAGKKGELVFLILFGIVFVHLMTAWPIWFLLKGFGLDVSLFAVVVAVTIGNIAGVIPVFPSGMGGRDLVVIAFLISAGVPEGAATSAQLIYTGILLVYTLAGGLFFVFDRGRKAGIPGEECP